MQTVYWGRGGRDIIVGVGIGWWREGEAGTFCTFCHFATVTLGHIFQEFCNRCKKEFVKICKNRFLSF